MFSCDTLWGCWMDLMREIGHGLYLMRWLALGYAMLYTVGAGIFLLSLRIKSVDGALTVNTRSLSYAIASPLRYGGHRSRHEGSSNICLFYVRLFHMLLLVWPFLLLYFILAMTVGNVLCVLVGNVYLTPDLHEDGFMMVHDLWPVWAAVVTIPLFLIVLAVINHTKLFHTLRVVSWAVACLIPMLVVIVIGSVLVYKVRNDDKGAVSVAWEVALSKKERLCKMIQYQ